MPSSAPTAFTPSSPLPVTAPPTTRARPCVCCGKRPSGPPPPASSSSSYSPSPSSAPAPAPARRQFLRRCVFTAASFLLGSSLSDPTRAEKTPTEPAPYHCQNCQGSGSVSCEMCSGTGFWKAVTGRGAADPKLTYKGVPCPECEGAGTIICPICLGTGEGNVRGLLRRRKITPGQGRVLQS